MKGRKLNPQEGQRRVLLIDDHPLMRLVVRNTLEAESDLSVCGESAGGDDAVALFQTTLPDLVLLDFFLQDTDAIELIMVLKKLNGRVPILIFSRIEDSLLAQRATRAGADGFMLKRESTAGMLNGIRQTIAGNPYFSPSIARTVMGQVLHPERCFPDTRFAALTETEQLIVRLLGQGGSLEQIAAELRTDANGLEAMNEKIVRKMKMLSFQELALYAVRSFGMLHSARFSEAARRGTMDES